jgi:Mn-containing catalase
LRIGARGEAGDERGKDQSLHEVLLGGPDSAGVRWRARYIREEAKNLGSERP